MPSAPERGYHVEMLILQSTPFCNLDCSYCYLPHRQSKQQMTEDTLARAFERVFASKFVGNHLTVLWHAGEPLVPGTAYYRRAFEILSQRKPDRIEITHHIQTNGTLLNQDWIDFLSTHQVQVGLSIDGPAHLHDRSRKTRRGGPTFDQTIRGLRLLQANSLPFHVITVLTRKSLQHARDLFDFYVDNGIGKIAFNVEEMEGEHTTSSLQGNDVEAEMRSFLRQFQALCESKPGTLEVREFVGAFAGIINPNCAHYGNPMAEPFRTLSIGVNGEISTFSPELLGYSSELHGPIEFGNVHTHSLDDVADHPRFRAVSDEIALGVERCRRSCEYFEICQGGSPGNKLFENGTFDSTETLFCRLSKKAVIDVVLERVERDLELAS
jgi:uncharacterized protein